MAAGNVLHTSYERYRGQRKILRPSLCVTSNFVDGIQDPGIWSSLDFLRVREAAKDATPLHLVVKPLIEEMKKMDFDRDSFRFLVFPWSSHFESYGNVYTLISAHNVKMTLMNTFIPILP